MVLCHVFVVDEVMVAGDVMIAVMVCIGAVRYMNLGTNETAAPPLSGATEMESTVAVYPAKSAQIVSVVAMKDESTKNEMVNVVEV